MSTKTAVILIGLGLGIAATIAGVVYSMNHNDSGHHYSTAAVPTGDAHVNVTNTTLEKAVTVSGTLNNPAGGSAHVEMAVKNGHPIGNITKSMEGTTATLDQTFDMSSQPPGDGYTAMVKMTTKDGQIVEMQKPFSLPNLAPVLKEINISKTNGNSYNINADFSDLDTLVDSGSLKILKADTKEIVSTHDYSFGEKTGTMVAKEKLDPGKYEIVAKVIDSKGASTEIKQLFTVEGTAELPLNPVPVIQSWSISPNTYTPKIFINVTDNDLEKVVMEVYNKTTKDKVQAKEYATAKVQDELDLNNLGPGDYTVKVWAQDRSGQKSTTLEQAINLPAPAANNAPQIVGDIQLTYNSAKNQWLFKVTAKDSDINGDFIYVKCVNKNTSESQWDYTGSNKNNQNSWSAEHTFDLFKGSYRIEAYAVDKEGLQSAIATKDFEQL